MQDAAIVAKRDAYLAAKWGEVIVSERGGRFDSWNYAKAQKKDGGQIYIVVASNGEVIAHEGYLTHDELRRAKAKKEKAKKSDAGKRDAQTPKSPITAAMRNYLDLHRHAAVRLAVIARPSDAMRLLIAHAVAASGNWSVKPDSCRADSKAVAETVEASEARKLFAAEGKAKQMAPVSVPLAAAGQAMNCWMRIDRIAPKAPAAKQFADAPTSSRCSTPHKASPPKMAMPPAPA